jgi:hypothetical protein
MSHLAIIGALEVRRTESYAPEKPGGVKGKSTIYCANFAEVSVMIAASYLIEPAIRGKHFNNDGDFTAIDNLNVNIVSRHRTKKPRPDQSRAGQ